METGLDHPLEPDFLKSLASRRMCFLISSLFSLVPPSLTSRLVFSFFEGTCLGSVRITG